MDIYSFGQIQKLCSENNIKPARGKGVTKKLLFNILVDKEIITIDKCPICLETLGEGKIIKTDCEHVYHKECIYKIRSKTCPLCRRKLKWKGCEIILKKLGERFEIDRQDREWSARSAFVQSFTQMEIEFEEELFNIYGNLLWTFSVIIYNSETDMHEIGLFVG